MEKGKPQGICHLCHAKHINLKCIITLSPFKLRILEFLVTAKSIPILISRGGGKLCRMLHLQNRFISFEPQSHFYLFLLTINIRNNINTSLQGCINVNSLQPNIVAITSLYRKSFLFTLDLPFDNLIITIFESHSNQPL